MTSTYDAVVAETLKTYVHYEMCGHGILEPDYCSKCADEWNPNVQRPLVTGSDNPHYDAQTILAEGAKAVSDRVAVRDADDGTKSMQRTVNIFNAMHSQCLSESEGWLFMAAVKLGRSQQGEFHVDDYIDAAAYIALAGEAADRGMLQVPSSKTSGGRV